MNKLMALDGFDWTLMRSFIAVMDEGSLQAAGRKLGASQPTLGRHISALEAQLGAALFERTGRQLVPTQLARNIAVHARTMEDSASSIGRMLMAQDEQAAGSVRIAASQTVACYLLPPLLAKLRQQAPGIEIELVASNQISNLLRREADIALRMVMPEQESLIVRKLGEVAMGIYAHESYLARRGTPANLAGLMAHDLLGFDTDESIIRGFSHMDISIDKHAFSFRSDDHIAIWQGIRNGLGIGFVANYVARTEPGIVQLLPDLPLPRLPMWLTVHREIRASYKIRVVYDFLAEVISDYLSNPD